MENKYLGQKMAEMREELLGMNLTKSGENTFAGFKYFELADILPSINKLAVKHKVFNKIDFLEDQAILTIINNENPTETFEFHSKLSEASIKGCNSVQNLGGTQTYLRRYLYFTAYEITDADTFDKIQGLKESKQRTLEIYNIGGQAGFSIPQINAHIKKKFGCELDKLAEDNAKQALTGYQNSIKKVVKEVKNDEEC